MDCYWKVTDRTVSRVVVVRARTEEEACSIAGVPHMASRRHPSVTVEKCGPSSLVVKGTMKDCCQDPVNIDWVGNGDDQEMGLCRVCQCRHFRTRCDPMQLGMRFMGK